MLKKTFIITGGNSGLGYETARQIAQDSKNNYVVLACRSMERGQTAAASLTEETGNSHISIIVLDLASLDSIRVFVKTFEKADFPQLQGIICNAGIILADQTHYTKEGYEATFGTNHLGHFLLVNLLLRDIAADGRIIFVSSGTHDPKQKTGIAAPVYQNARLLAYPENERNSKESNIKIGQRRYTTSKLCNVYCTYALADKLSQETTKHITVNAFDPGEMPGTGFSRTFPAPAKFFVAHILPYFNRIRKNAHSARQSGESLAHLVLDRKYDGITHKFFRGLNEVPSSKLSYNQKNQEDLWKSSVELTKLTAAETIIDI